jgi:hypothetical protein
VRITRSGIAAIVIAGTLAVGASPASARIGCNPENPDPPCPAAFDDSYSTAMGVAFTVTGANGVMKNDFGPQSLVVSVEDSDATSFYGNAAITMHSSGGLASSASRISPSSDRLVPTRPRCRSSGLQPPADRARTIAHRAARPPAW